MEIISEETIFHQTHFWTTTTADHCPPVPTGETSAEEGGSGRSSPCPPSSSKDKTNRDVPMPDVREEPKRVLEPLPTFTTDWKREVFFTPSFAPPSPPSSSFLRSPPSCSSSDVFFAAGSGPGEVRGYPGEGGGWSRGEKEQNAPIHLAPIHLPAFEAVRDNREFSCAPHRFVDKQVPPKKRGKRLGVAPVPLKKSPMRNHSLAGGLVVLKTTSTTTTTTTLSPPASPPASSSRCRSPPQYTSAVVPMVVNNAQDQSSVAQRGDNNRKRVNSTQLAILEDAFERGMIPDLETRRRLASVLGFTERRVQIWFQNRRAKMKKDNQQSSVFIINCGIESYKN